MNILKKISAAASIIAIAMLSSCSDKGYWDEAPLEEGYSFQSSQYSETLGPGANEIVIPIDRTNNTGAQTVNITFTPGKNCPADIVVPSQVTFAAGSNTANIVITVTDAMPAYTYSGTLEFDGNASYSGNTVIEFKCPVEYIWQSIGKGGFIDTWVMEGIEDLYPVEILKADGFDRWRVVNPYVEYYVTGGKEANGDWYGSNGPAYIEFWETETGTLSFNAWYTGLNYQGVKNQPINAYPWTAFGPGNGFDETSDMWYQPGYAVLSPIYYIPGVGNFGQAPYAVQIQMPE